MFVLSWVLRYAKIFRLSTGKHLNQILFYFRYTGPGAVPDRYGPLPSMESSLQVPRRIDTRHMSLTYDIGSHGKL